MERVETSPPYWASGLDCGEWPVVSPCSRSLSSRTWSGTPHSTVTCMFSASIASTRSRPEPSSTMVSSTAVSRPPSVPVRPVRATTLILLSFAKARTFETSSVERALTIAAGSGASKMPCTDWYFLNRSTLASFSSSVSVTTCPASSIPVRWATMSSRVSLESDWAMVIYLLVCGAWGRAWRGGFSGPGSPRPPGVRAR